MGNMQTKYILKLVFYFLLFQCAVFASNVVDISTLKSDNLLKNSYIYNDQTNSETIETIKDKSFTPINQTKSLSFGYSPNFTLWIKFTLTNNSDEVKEKIIEYEAQNHIINLLDTYVKDPKNKYSVIPAMLSADGEKGGAISAYNEALMERDKITKSTNSVNPLSEIADSQIDKLRDGVVLAIDNARKSSQFVLNDLKSQEKAIMSKMDYVPTYEREYLDYKRQQEILQGVYLILLQKREEVALSLGQERDKGFIVDAAVAKYRPVAPRKLFAVLGFLILTIVIPMGYLFAKQQLRDLIDIYKRK